MDTGIKDYVAGSLILLFTGVNELSNLGETGFILDAISKIGTVAVLYMWVVDLKKQMNRQVEEFTKTNERIVSAFDKETDELRTNYKTVIDELTKINSNQHDRLMSLLMKQNEDLNQINKKIK